MRARRIRVTQVLEATVGGTRRHLRDVVAALSGDEFKVHVICALGRDATFQDDIDMFRDAGHCVSVVGMKPGIQPIGDLRAAVQLRRLLREPPCDVLHLHSAKAGWLGRLVRPGPPCRVIYSPHAFPFLRLDRRFARWSYGFAERLVSRRTDVLLAVSEAEAKLAVESGLFHPSRVGVLQNAIDVGDLDRQLDKLSPLHDRPGTRTFGLIGELRLQKGTFIFLEAVRLLRERGVPISVVLPLLGPQLADAMQFVRDNDLDDMVEFVPSKNSLVTLLRRTEIAVLPSLWEGLPYTMLEALALRRPVIASDLPVFEDLLGPLDSRLTFRQGSATELAERMIHWARVPASELDALGVRGRKYVEAHHELGDWKDGVRGLYRSLASRR